ncbi:hypothetical protein CPC08DRAFT_705911 [Agrocybe pediades]|nr:hypothetical protein CPC08DRAFT_705911 [Agrocybe pediades]
MNLIQLPPEIFRHICESCETKAELASLAQTHSACQMEAEAVLYQNVTDICLSTLASNPQKAKLVRCLVAGRVNCKGNLHKLRSLVRAMHGRIKAYLSDALRNTTALRVLWIDIDYWARQPQGWDDEMNNSLCDTLYDQLHTFYFNVGGLDVDRILDSFPRLKTLIADYEFADKLIKMYRRTRSSHFDSERDQSASGSLVPRTQGVRSDFRIYAHTRSLNALGLFPGLQSHSEILQTVWHHEPGPGRINFLWTGTTTRPVIHHVQIYLVDTHLSRDSEVLTFIKDLTSIVAPRTWFRLSFFFEHPVETEPEDIKETLSLLPELVELVFLPFGHTEPLPPIPSELRRAQAEEYKRVCPNLETVTFIDYNEVIFDTMDMNLSE